MSKRPGAGLLATLAYRQGQMCLLNTLHMEYLDLGIGPMRIFIVGEGELLSYISYH